MLATKRAAVSVGCLALGLLVLLSRQSGFTAEPSLEDAQARLRSSDFAGAALGSELLRPPGALRPGIRAGHDRARSPAQDYAAETGQDAFLSSLEHLHGDQRLVRAAGIRSGQTDRLRRGGFSRDAGRCVGHAMGYDVLLYRSLVRSSAVPEPTRSVSEQAVNGHVYFEVS